MIENFLHYVWLYKKIDVLHLRTTQLIPLEVISVGFPNPNSGPDFFNGQLRIGEQHWAGNIEIHIKSSDWYVHNHQTDKAYDNVILHVVYEHDMDIFRKDNSVIPTLELKPYIHKDLFKAYNQLMSKQHEWINCEYAIHEISELTWKEWVDRLFFERLEVKSNLISKLLATTKNDWEAVLFVLLAKNFGLKINSEAFLSIATSFDFSLVKKVRGNQSQMEALLFGQAGLLELNYDITYFRKLNITYKYLKHKFQLDRSAVLASKFFRLRPINFPTIRLSQLASLYFKEPQLFSKVIEAELVTDYYKIFDVETSKFWETHYTFNKETKAKKKKISKAFINLIVINTILPLKFYYSKTKGSHISEHLVQIIKSIPSENNIIIDNFKTLNISSPNAMTSQALIHLKTVYCDHNKCLKCAVGHTLLSK